MSSSNPASHVGDERVEALREAMTMALYVSIVLLAALTALPSGGEGGDGMDDIGLVGLIWGTTVGLALAHWFAFRLTARGFGGGKLSERDVRIGLAQMAGAACVALLCTIPVILVGEVDDVRVTRFVPAFIVGVAGYFVARAAGRARTRSFIFGGLVMIVGFTVASVKNFLVGH